MDIISSRTQPFVDGMNTALDDLYAAQERADRAAVHALVEIMRDRRWYAVAVDEQECSMIEEITDSEGRLLPLSTDDADKLVDTMFTIVGNCPRAAFRYRNGKYRTTIKELTRFRANM